MDCVGKFGSQQIPYSRSACISLLNQEAPYLSSASGLGIVGPRHTCPVVEVFCQVPFSGTPSIGHCPSDNTDPQTLVSVEMPTLCFYNGMPWGDLKGWCFFCWNIWVLFSIFFCVSSVINTSHVFIDDHQWAVKTLTFTIILFLLVNNIYIYTHDVYIYNNIYIFT